MSRACSRYGSDVVVHSHVDVLLSFRICSTVPLYERPISNRPRSLYHRDMCGIKYCQWWIESVMPMAPQPIGELYLFCDFCLVTSTPCWSLAKAIGKCCTLTEECKPMHGAEKGQAWAISDPVGQYGSTQDGWIAPRSLRNVLGDP